MMGKSDQLTLSVSQKTFYYPHDAARTGKDKMSDFPPEYFKLETSRLTENDFVKGKGKISDVKFYKGRL